MQPKQYHASDHEIDHNLIDQDALYIIRKLRDAGFSAYLVGGSVRDLLIKKTPKDYDISTSALPEQIKQIFHRSCLLIGRRFRLAHIRFGHKIIEVATFRSGDNESDLIVQDNQWGTPEQDVLRRDFTINGLFYDPFNHTVIDYVGGWEDIFKRVLRTIGEPVIRFKQDPVRMIRLLKFRARFGFEIDNETRRALFECRDEMVKSSPARILEEIFRMLESGASAPFIHLMAESGLWKLLFPSLHHFLEGEHGKEVYQHLAAADSIHLNSGRRPMERAVLASSLLFPIVEHEIRAQYLSKGHMPHLGQIMILTSSIIKDMVTSSFSHFPRRISAAMGFILAMQYRLTPLTGKRHFRPKLMHHKEFDQSLKFLKIRALVNERVVDAYSWWKNIHRQTEKHGEKKGNPNSHSHERHQTPPVKTRHVQQH